MEQLAAANLKHSAWCVETKHLENTMESRAVMDAEDSLRDPSGETSSMFVRRMANASSMWHEETNVRPVDSENV